MYSIFDRKFNPITTKDKTLTTPAPLAKSDTKKRVMYNRWVNRYSEILYRYAHWILRDAEQATNMTHRTFTRVWSQFDNISNGKNPRVKLFGLMYSELANNSGRNQPLQKINAQPMFDSTAKNPRTVDREVDKTLVEISVEMIPSHQMKLIGLQLLGGFNDAEISLISGLTQAQVRRQITTAKLHLLGTEAQRK